LRPFARAAGSERHDMMEFEEADLAAPALGRQTNAHRPP